MFIGDDSKSQAPGTCVAAIRHTDNSIRIDLTASQLSPSATTNLAIESSIVAHSRRFYLEAQVMPTQNAVALDGTALTVGQA